MAGKSKHTEKHDKKAKRLATKGLTDKAIAEFFNVSERTLNNWKKQFPLFFQSLKNGKAMTDAGVEASLYQRATGYSVPDVHISSFEGDITITPIIKHYPPDPTSCIFWLKNRKPDQWADRQEVKLKDLPPIVVNLNVQKNGITELQSEADTSKRNTG